MALVEDCYCWCCLLFLLLLFISYVILSTFLPFPYKRKKYLMETIFSFYKEGCILYKQKLNGKFWNYFKKRNFLFSQKKHLETNSTQWQFEYMAVKPQNYVSQWTTSQISFEMCNGIFVLECSKKRVKKMQPGPFFEQLNTMREEVHFPG